MKPLSSPLSRSAKRQPRHAAPRVSRCRPRLERLEDRTVPSATLAVSDASAVEGDGTGLKVHDRFVSEGSGGLARPRGSSFGPDGNGDGAGDLYVASSDTDAILRYDGVTGSFIDAFVTSGSGGLDNPLDVAFGPEGDLYVSSQGTNQVLRYDGASGAYRSVVAGGLNSPMGLTFAADGSLYIANQGTNEVLRYRASGLSVFVAAGSGGLSQPRQAAFGPDGNGDGTQDLYVASQGTSQVLRYDGVTGAFLGTFATTGEAPGMMWLEFGTDGYLYTTGRPTAGSVNTSINRFSAATGAFVDRFDLGRDGWSFSLGTDNLVYSSTNSAANFIDRIGPSSVAAFTVSLSSPSAVQVTVNYATTNGTATAGSDYTAVSGTVTFAPGQTVQTVIVPVLDDSAAEPTESFTLNLSGPVGATITDGVGVAAINDDDTTIPWPINFGAQQVVDVGTDNLGNVYTTGYFSGTVDFKPGPGVVNLTSAGNTDAYVAKYSSDGSLLWVRGIGGTGDDFSWTLDVTDNGVYVGGHFSGQAYFGNTILTSVDDVNGYVARLDGNGVFTLVAQLGRSVEGVSADPSGNVLTTGFFMGNADLDPGPGTALLTGGGSFVSKLDTNGNHVWARRVNDEIGSAIDTDALGNVYVHVIENTTAGDGGAHVVTKLDPAGTTVWTVSRTDIQINGSPRNGLVVDDRDANPANWTVVYDSHSGGSVVPRGLLVLKHRAADGVKVWERAFANTNHGTKLGEMNQGPRGLALSPTGDVYVTGSFDGAATDFDPGPGTAYLSPFNPYSGDIFLLRLDSAGNYVAARRMGGNSRDSGQGLAVDSTGMVYLAGAFAEDTHSGVGTFDTGAQSVSLYAAAGSAFVVKLDPSYGAITGRVVHDANANGGNDEPFGLQGWTVYLDQNGNGQLDAGEPTTTTDRSGVYTFGQLPAGTYTVALVPQNGWATAGSATTTLAGDGRFFQHTFANTTAPVVRTYASPNVPVTTVRSNYVYSTLTIPDIVNILDLDVTLSLTHNKLQNIYIDLIGPDGRSSPFAWYGDAGKNFTNTTFDMDAATSIQSGSAPYTGRFRPYFDGAGDVTLDWWDGQLAAGTWTLRIQDLHTASGTLTSWALNITSAPPPPTISINDVSLIEGNGGTQTATFTVSLSGPSAQAVTVNYATADGTAAGGSDYVAGGNVLTFLPGQTSKTVSITVNGDTAVETNETFFVNLSGAANGVIGDGQGVGTITDDDSTKFFVVDDASPDRTYRYGAPGNAQSNSTLSGGNTAPRGIASNPTPRTYSSPTPSRRQHRATRHRQQPYRDHAVGGGRQQDGLRLQLRWRPARLLGRRQPGQQRPGRGHRRRPQRHRRLDRR